jgi:hypothetical protein
VRLPWQSKALDQLKLIQPQPVQLQAKQLNRESRMLRSPSWRFGAQRSANGDLSFRVFEVPSDAHKLRDSTTRQDSVTCAASVVALNWTFHRSQQVEIVVRLNHECQLNSKTSDRYISVVPRPVQEAVQRMAAEHQTQRCSLPANGGDNPARVVEQPLPKRPIEGLAFIALFCPSFYLYAEPTT